MKEGYIPKEQRKKILLLCDDVRWHSGIATMAREIVIGTAHHYNWVNIGGQVNNPDKNKKFDLNDDTNKQAGITDASVTLYPMEGYGNSDIIRQMIKDEKPDALMIFTDPRYWIWLFQVEQEIRRYVPIIYLNIWDDLPYPMYNKPYYESCDALLAISKQTENINKVVLGNLANEKVIKYVPHGINENHFFPITVDLPEYLTLQEFKKRLFKGKTYKYTLLYNARNIHRKAVPNILLSWKMFLEGLDEAEAKECCLVLHTQMMDENGTDLIAVKEMLFGYNNDNIIFDTNKYPVPEMNLLYNSCDGTILISSNEGWGLSLTESMMCGRPIIGTVTGGMQDQMRFQDKEGKWINFTEEFGSNHRGKYKICGKWAFPVFPSNISLMGSIPTPYIYDDRVDPKDVTQQIKKLYAYKNGSTIAWDGDKKITYEELGKAAREWVTSDESMMSARWMCKNVIEGIDATFEKWEPRYSYELINVKLLDQPKHYVKYPVAV